MGHRHTRPQISFKKMLQKNGADDGGHDPFDLHPQVLSEHEQARAWLSAHGFTPGAVLSHAELRAWVLNRPKPGS